MRVTAIVLAAGRGLRFRSKTPKPLVKINAKPIIIYSLQVLNKHPLVKDIIVVVNPRNQAGIAAKLKQYRIRRARQIVRGGLRRQDSVRNALKFIDRHTDFVLIHDSGRPFIDSRLISSVINAARKSGAAIAGVPVKATVKEVRSKNTVKKTLNRENLWEIQTPQLFRRDLILNAYNKFGKEDVTDDAMLVEKLGGKVSVVLGSYDNIKITTPEDLVIAEAIAKKWNRA